MIDRDLLARCAAPYEVDITDIQNQQEQLWDMLNSLIIKISGIG